MLIYLSIITVVTIIIVVWYMNSKPADRTELPGSNKCTWGPAFFCANRENAAQCNVDYDNVCAKQPSV